MFNMNPRKMADLVYKRVPETKYAIAAVVSTLLMLATGSIGGLLEIATEPLWLLLLGPIALSTGVFAKMKPVKLKWAAIAGAASLALLYLLGLKYMYGIQDSYRFAGYCTWTVANATAIGYLLKRFQRRKQEIVSTLQSAYLDEVMTAQGVPPEMAKMIQDNMANVQKMQSQLNSTLATVERSPAEVEKILRDLQTRSHSHRKPAKRKR